LTNKEDAHSGPSRAIFRGTGVTISESYLKRLCERSFLSLWSYPNIYRNESRPGGKNEICDLLVVFEDNIIIFSDKNCSFPDTGDLSVDWNRWFKKAIKESAKQIWGAEKWIKENPDNLYLDPACTHKFPIPLPNLATAKFHRLVVAHDTTGRIRDEIGGSGSFIIAPDIVGNMHFSLESQGMPFAIGQIDPHRGYVHVLNDSSLEIVMSTLDTVTDFVSYLTKKERFVMSGRLVCAAGEEELLGFYLKDINEEGEHDFIFPDDGSRIILDEGFWERFTKSRQRQAQIRSDKISYLWDTLIERFSEHILQGTQYIVTPHGFEDGKRIMRFMAKESRFRRRQLSIALVGAIMTTPSHLRRLRVVKPTKSGEPYYVFLLLPRVDGDTDELYREVRLAFLHDCCFVAKLSFPEAEDIIGIATESGNAEDTVVRP
jgi:hypothetical protein